MNVLYVVSFGQYLNSSFRLVLLSGDMYPRKPISNGITFTFALVMSGMKWAYFSALLVWAFRILVLIVTVSSKMNSSFVNLSWMTISGRSAGVTQRSGEIAPPPGREYPSISALSWYFSLSSFSHMYLRILSCISLLVKWNFTTIHYMVGGLLSARLEVLVCI